MQYLNINMQTIYEKIRFTNISPVESITLVLTSIEDSGLPQKFWNIHVARLSVMLTFLITELNVLHCSL